MNQVTDRNFGFLIAYLLPGFVGLATISNYSAIIQAWLGNSTAQSPTVGGFLYVTLGSVALGLTISAIRWLILDSLHHRTGIHEPQWNFAALQANLPAFDAAVQNHYRYYQFYGNMLVALLLGIAAHRSFGAALAVDASVLVIAFPLIVIVLFAASRDALRKYYARSSALLNSQHI